MGCILKVLDLVQAWLGTQYSSAFLGFEFAKELPDSQYSLYKNNQLPCKVSVSNFHYQKRIFRSCFDVI